MTHEDLRSPAISPVAAAAGAAALSTTANAQSPGSLTHDIPLAGADPTGEKDSSTAFQRTVDKAADLGGGTILIPSGKYLIEQPIDLRFRRGIRFVGVSSGGGSGAGSQLHVARSGMNLFEMEQSKGILFQNLFLHRDPVFRSDRGDGFHGIDQTSDCRFLDCTVFYFYHGAFLQNSWQNYFRGCLICYCEIGAKVDVDGTGQSNDTKFEQCLVGQCSTYEIEINANTVYVFGCELESITSQWGIFGRFGRDCVIANCSYIRGVNLGLEYARVTGNGVIGSPNQAGILLVRANHAIVNSNVIRDSVGHGIKFYQSNDVLIEGNQILHSGSYASNTHSGVLLQEGSNRNNIRSNIIRRGSVNTKHGVDINNLNGADGNAIVSNDLRDSSISAPFSDGGLGTIASGNIIS